MTSFAVMNIDNGEETVIANVSGHIAGTGRYKFLAKKKVNGKYEWVHFVERDNGIKENVYRAEVNDEEELKIVLDIANMALKRIFGAHTEMIQGIPEFRSITGQKFGDTMN